MIPILRSGSLAAVIAVACASPVLAQQIGKEPWDAQARSASLPAQFQFQKKYGSGSGGGLDALTQYVTNYNSSSTSIGNYTEVNQTLGDGATGTVSQSATQDSSGTQTSTADDHDNQTSNNNVSAAGKGKGDRSATVLGLSGQQN